MINKMLRFFNEVKAEIGKVTWPKREEFIGSTIIVFILIAFFAVILGVIDYSFSSLIKKIFSYY